MEKIWLQSYAPGVPAEIDPDAYQSILEVFLQSVQKYRHRQAFSNFGVSLTYRQVDKYSRSFAAYLQQELKLKKGDRLAIMLPNLLQYPIALFAAMHLGVIIVNVNPLYTADELTHQMNDSGAETLFVVENFAKTVEKALPNMPNLKNIIVTGIGDLLGIRGLAVNFFLRHTETNIPEYNIPNTISFKHTLSKGKRSKLTPAILNNQDIAFLQYTGGTTGISKGAILTHRNIVANIVQADAWFKSILIAKQEIIITALPLYHIFSLTANCLYFSKIGGLNVLITNPRDISRTVKEISRFKFTAITAVNTLFNALLKNPQFAKLDFSSLHLSLGGGMAVQQIVAEKWQQMTHRPLLEAYGLTETSPCATINPTSAKGFNGSIGLPVSSTEVIILGDDGLELPIGQAGELGIKGPQVMKGYWNNPLETAKVFTKEGWLLTGDIATIDQKGFVRLLERKKDMILVSGFNVYPNEIEDVIIRLPGVREVAVIAVVDEVSGEVPKAFIVKDDPNLLAETVIKHARKHLTPYKIPKYVTFLDELPKSPVGKILRRSLRDLK